MGKIIKNGIAYSTASENAYNINFNNTNTTLNAVTVQEAIAELNDKIDNFEIPEGSVSAKDIVVSLSLENWVLNEEDNTYIQEVTAEGIKEDNDPVIVIAPVGNVATEVELNAFNCLEEAITGDGVITFIATKLPEIDFSVAIKGAIGGSGEAPSADLTELENRVTALENKVVESGKDIEITLTVDGWVLDEAKNVYIYTAAADEVTEDTNPIVVLKPAEGEATEDELNSYSNIMDISTTEGQIIFMASEKPSVDFSVIVKTGAGSTGSGSGIVSEFKDVNITLSLDKWELNENNKYSQVADVTGLTETATPLVLLKSTSEETLKAYNCITESIVEKDKITFIADEVPTMDIDLVVKNVVPSDSTIVDDISELREEVENKLAIDGDSKDNVITFTSNDSAEVSEYIEVELLTSGEKHSSLFNKVSTMFKNIRYIVKTLGTTDISAIGDGTVKGAISTLNSDLANLIKVDEITGTTSENGNVAISYKPQDRQILFVWSSKTGTYVTTGRNVAGYTIFHAEDGEGIAVSNVELTFKYLYVDLV